MLDFDEDSPILDFFHPVLAARELGNKPVAVQVGGCKIVLFRGADGKPAAVQDRCPHRFTPLAGGRVLPNGRLACPYHGWNFDAEGTVRNPGVEPELMRCRIRNFTVREQYGYLWLANPNTTQELPSFPLPETDGSSWDLLAAYTMPIDAPIHLMLDNLSEEEHFPYVHKTFGWSMQQAKRVKFECSKGDDAVNISYLGPQRNFPFMQLLGLRRGQWVRNDWVVRFKPVHFSYLTRSTDESGRASHIPVVSSLNIFLVPVGKEKSVAHTFHFVRFERRGMRWMLPLFKAIFGRMVRRELSYDVELMGSIKSVPYSLKGTHMGPFDRPIVYARNLFESIYLKGGRQGKAVRELAARASHAQPDSDIRELGSRADTALSAGRFSD